MTGGPDPVAYLDWLAGRPLYLASDTSAGRTRLVTIRRDGHTYLLAGSSLANLRDCLGGTQPDTCVVCELDHLARHWPDPAWRLAVDPYLDSGAWLSIVDIVRHLDLAGAAAGRTIAAFEPACAAERDLDAALLAGDADSFYQTLARAPLLLPEAAPPGGDPHTIAVFTSTRRLAEAMDPAVRVAPVRLAQLARGWPDPAYRLAVNPGSPLAVLLTGADLADVVQPGVMPIAGTAIE
jgi:hypothetical protein